jgi:uncharacterized membrane protein
MYFKKYLRLSVLFTLILMLARIVVSDSFHYIFLPWNLFLAYIPLWISHKQLSNTATKRLGLMQHLFFAVWLLFLPNAPYIITDLIHLKERSPIPFYFDIVLVFTTAVNGLIFFYVSVAQVEQWWRKNFGNNTIGWYYFLAFGLCSFGIYLGRFGRFNSWNIITKPKVLFGEIVDRILLPFEHPQTWAVTILFSSMLFLLYQLFKNYKSSDIETVQP